jgi:leucyl aminopeptidase
LPREVFKPWLHLDIAGTDWNEKAQSYLAEGPTGVGVGILRRLVERLAKGRDG